MEREEFWGLKCREHTNRTAAWPMKQGGKLEDAKRKLPPSPPSLLIAVVVSAVTAPNSHTAGFCLVYAINHAFSVSASLPGRTSGV